MSILIPCCENRGGLRTETKLLSLLLCFRNFDVRGYCAPDVAV